VADSGAAHPDGISDAGFTEIESQSGNHLDAASISKSHDVSPEVMSVSVAQVAHKSPML
jgi:hypothetical protein